jgi:hypothetical protein
MFANNETTALLRSSWEALLLVATLILAGGSAGCAGADGASA